MLRRGGVSRPNELTLKPQGNCTDSKTATDADGGDASSSAICGNAIQRCLKMFEASAL
jgi:hypothetical protein